MSEIETAIETTHKYQGEPVVSARVPQALYRELSALAKAESRNISNMMLVLLKEALAQRKGAKQ